MMGRSNTICGFGCADDDTTFGSVDNTSGDCNYAMLFVYVAPFQSYALTAPYARSNQEVKHTMKVERAIRLEPEKLCGLFLRQCVHRLLSFFGASTFSMGFLAITFYFST